MNLTPEQQLAFDKMHLAPGMSTEAFVTRMCCDVCRQRAFDMRLGEYTCYDGCKTRLYSITILDAMFAKEAANAHE